MTWSAILGHDDLVQRFRQAVQRGRLGSTFLFVGPDGVGKRTFAIKLAQTLLCDRTDLEQFEACGECSGCIHVLANSHPDIVSVARPADKNVIPLDLLIGDREHRGQSGLCHEISLTPYSGKYKIAIIDDADSLGLEGANCLLKTLEEPPSRSILILIGTSVQRQLPTVLSRCQVIHFSRLANAQVADLLTKHALADSDQIATLAELSHGSVVEALENADEDLRTFRRQFVEDLCRPNWNALEASDSAAKFVEAAGKDAPKRRRRLQQLLVYVATFYRELMLRLAHTETTPPRDLAPLLQAAAERWPADSEAAGLCSLRTLETMEHLAASGNLATLVPCWLDDVYRLSHPLAATRK